MSIFLLVKLLGSLSLQIKNLIEESVKRIKKYDPKCIADVRSCPELINFSENQKLLNKQLKSFLRKKYIIIVS